MVGQLDDGETWRRAQVAHASLVATTLADTTNANVALTVREVAALRPDRGDRRLGKLRGCS